MNKEEEMARFREKFLPQYITYVKEQQEAEKLYNRQGKRVKQCRICGEYKVLSAFYKNPLKKFGCFDECKQCLKFIRMKRKCE